MVPCAKSTPRLIDGTSPAPSSRMNPPATPSRGNVGAARKVGTLDNPRDGLGLFVPLCRLTQTNVSHPLLRPGLSLAQQKDVVRSAIEKLQRPLGRGEAHQEGQLFGLELDGHSGSPFQCPRNSFLRKVKHLAVDFHSDEPPDRKSTRLNS